MTQPLPSMRWPNRVALAWAVLVAVALFALFPETRFDDPFITYRYAANLAHGVGFVYNPGERILSTTAPLYALVLTPAAAVGLSLPVISNGLSCLSLGAGALALWHMGRVAAQRVAGAVAALLFPLSPFLVPTLGAETASFIALTLWGLVAAWSGRPILAGLLLVSATLTRGDAALGLVLAGFVLAMRWGWRSALTFGTICGFVLTPFLLMSWWYYGTPLPATLGAKRSQAQIPGSRSYLQGLLDYLRGMVVQPLFWPTVGLTPLGLVAAVRDNGPLALTVAWGLLHALAYSLIGVTAYFWYYAPAFVGLLAAVALGAELLARWLTRRAGLRAGRSVVATLIFVVLIGHLGAVRDIFVAPQPRMALYHQVGLWLQAHTPVGSQVGTLEIGVIGFYGERPMVDFAGLIQPEVSRVLAGGGDYAAAARYAIAHYRPTYLVNQETTLALLSADPALQAHCTEAVALPDPRYATPLVIARCVWP